jgi:hypothetical protein
MAASVQHIKNKITAALSKYAAISKAEATTLLPGSLTSGKLYEAHILSRLCEKLVVSEGCQLTLVGGTNVKLRTSPGPITARFPHIEVRRSGSLVGEVWTDIEFLSLSYSHVAPRTPTQGHYHELDIVMVEPGATGRPAHDEILLGIECKNTGYAKSLLREILGVRRELSLLTSPQPTAFKHWPTTSVPAKPPSCLVVYSTDPAVANFSAPGKIFGIEFIHDPL